MSLRSFAIVCLGLVLAAPSWAQERPSNETCPHDKGWKPTNEELQRILSDHERWLESGKSGAKVSNEGKVNLCNANLSKADLRFAILDGADLSGTELNDANLFQAKLNNADLSWTELDHANLIWAELNHANLTAAKLSNVDLVMAKLNNANLTAAELDNAELPGAELNNADLSRASLNKANLFQAKLNNANLSDTSIAGAGLAYADLTDAIYAPQSSPPASVVVGIRGLRTVTFPAGNETGLVQLRDLLQKAGLRDLEREATFAIESGNTRNSIDGWKENPAKAAEGAFRYVAFGLTTRYGLQPGRALLLIVALWALLIPLYA